MGWYGAVGGADCWPAASNQHHPQHHTNPKFKENVRFALFK